MKALRVSSAIYWTSPAVAPAMLWPPLPLTYMGQLEGT